MSEILTRIKIKNVKGAEIAYLYHKETLEKIGLQPDGFDPKCTFINVGSEFTIEDKMYRVVNIATIFFPETYDVEDKGTNLYAMDEQVPFNFQITYIVENV